MTEQFPPANEFIVPVNVFLHGYEQIQLRKYLNLHYLGDVDANQLDENKEMVAKYPEKETQEYKNAVANAIRAIIHEYEYFQDDDGYGSMVVSSDDLRNLAYELEKLK